MHLLTGTDKGVPRVRAEYIMIKFIDQKLCVALPLSLGYQPLHDVLYLYGFVSICV